MKDKVVYWKFEISRENGQFDRAKARRLSKAIAKSSPDFVDWWNASGVMFKFRNQEVKDLLVPKLERAILDWEEKELKNIKQ